MARGISYGGSCLGFEYDFDKCIKALDIVYDSYKRNERLIMTDYEESYKNYLAWLTPRELLKEYKIMSFPWRYRERKWIKEEIESRCVY
jgi:hypothetical protein